MDKNEINDDELKTRLSPEEYAVLRDGATEAPFSGKYLKAPADGVYHCKVCNAPLFNTHTQEDAEKSPAGLRGWPSFNDAIPHALEFKPDDSGGMHRTEVVCAKCGSHLGHLFDDPGTKTGKHYCVNSVCLNLEEE